MGTRGPRVPVAVLLPATAMVEAGHLRTCLGASKALLTLWRRAHAFPATFRDHDGRWYSLTDDVAKWCERHGVTVRRV